MTPREAAALLRVRQLRERRAQAAARAARQAQGEATVLRTAAEQARTDFAAVARQRRNAAYGWLEQADDVRASALQRTAAKVAELRMQDAALMAMAGRRRPRPGSAPRPKPPRAAGRPRTAPGGPRWSWRRRSGWRTRKRTR